MSILLLCFFVDNSYLSPSLSISSQPVALSMGFVLCPHAVEAPQQQQIVQHLEAATEVERPATQQQANMQQQRAQVNITTPQLARVSSTLARTAAQLHSFGRAVLHLPTWRCCHNPTCTRVSLPEELL